jgi:HPt (histidine-containing phosphotransfer) domain-containing protein
MNYKFINTVYLETIVSGGDKEIIRELVGIFREQVVEMVKEMNSLYAKEDFYSLAMLAHKAKSSVAIMGMNDLAIMLKTFELDGTNKENYKLYILRFENETRQAVEELENYINNL